MIIVVNEDGAVVKLTDALIRALKIAMAKKLKISTDIFEASLWEDHPIKYQSKSELYSTIISFENEYTDVIVSADDVFMELIRGLPDIRRPKQNGCASIW